MALGKTRFTWNPQVNFKQGFSEESLIDDASALLTGLFYVVVPSLLKLNGWLGFAVGAGIPYLLGKLLRAPGMCSAALGIGITHVLMAKTSDSVANMLGQPIWTLNTVPASTSTTQTTTVPDMNLVETVNDLITLPNGERIVQFSPDEIDRMSIPINDNVSGVADVVSTQQQIAWNGQMIRKPQQRRTFGYLQAA